MLDYIGIFRALNKKKIKYIVAGGVAVNLHGVPRMTYDIDLLLEMSDENLKKFLNLFKSFGFKAKLPVDMMDLVDKKKRQIWIKNKNLRAFCLVNPDWIISEIDVLINTPVPYEKAIKNAVYFEVDKNIIVPTVSLNDLIKMKKTSDRKQDISDIEHLLRKKK